MDVKGVNQLNNIHKAWK